MTPAAFHAYVEGYLETQKDNLEIQRTMAYNLAIMVRAAVGAKHMPTYKQFFPPQKSKKTMSDEAMYQQVLALNSMLGGTVSGGEE